jgi:hypothetical protein
MFGKIENKEKRGVMQKSRRGKILEFAIEISAVFFLRCEFLSVGFV